MEIGLLATHMPILRVSHSLYIVYNGEASWRLVVADTVNAARCRRLNECSARVVSVCESQRWVEDVQLGENLVVIVKKNAVSIKQKDSYKLIEFSPVRTVSLRRSWSIYTLSQKEWKSKLNDLSFLKEQRFGCWADRVGGWLFLLSWTCNRKRTFSNRCATSRCGTTRSEVDAERSRWHAALLTDTVRSDKYTGAVPFRQSYTSTQNFYWIVVVPAASVSPSDAVSHDRISGHLSLHFYSY